ncbi:hypothetical protein AVEN_252250-1 [Araneus ventricosus]|uniref:Uncharacterized protein n=1 Tax=Araneus ventricosus TaxID=182803 RepID=A0A4Y2UUV4_ARAVE|nr:hypothetical protein AVEN_252250-1 [Araneus ventricosus]
MFFLGTFFAFIVAEETGEYYESTIISGFVMLAITTVFFCCVLHESKSLRSSDTEPAESNEPQPEQKECCFHSLEPAMRVSTSTRARIAAQPYRQNLSFNPKARLRSQPGRIAASPSTRARIAASTPTRARIAASTPTRAELPLQPQPEPKLSGKPKKESHWYGKTRLHFVYVRQILGFSPRDTDETTSSEDDSDPDMLKLRKLEKSGLPTGNKDPMAGTSKESQAKDATKCEGAADFQLDSTKAGPSKVAGKKSEVTESRYDDVPLKDMSALSLSDSSKCTTDSEDKQAEVSAALCQLSLNSSEKQAAKMSAQDPSSTDFEGKIG